MSEPVAPPLLQVSSLSVAYGKVEAVHQVSLRLHAGSIATVVGPNGAGKTSLLAAIMGLLPSRGAICVIPISPADSTMTSAARASIARRA